LFLFLVVGFWWGTQTNTNNQQPTTKNKSGPQAAVSSTANRQLPTAN
jgi:hypothetical protein